MSNSSVSVRHQDNVAIVTLDDGKVNVFSLAMAQQLQTTLEALDPEVGAVLVTGRPGVFSAGFDLKTIGTGDPAAIAAMVGATVKMALDVMRFPRPVIGAASGHMVAMGCLLMQTMDYRIGARGAFRYGLNEVRDGLPLPIFAIELARYRLPKSTLFSSTLHSQLYDADGAVTAGFLDEAAESAALFETALARAKQLATLPNPAYRISKANLAAPVREYILRTLEQDLAGKS